MKQTSIKLNTGTSIPQLGFGTWQINPSFKAEKATAQALEIGYRHVDTARVYLNERGVGKAVRQSGVARKDVFVTTKLWRGDKNPAKALDKSIKRLGLDYVDLYLMHWPQEDRIDAWRAMEQIQKSGKARAIGVSNFTIKHLTELMEQTDIVPAVNQVEFHPFLYQKELLEFCNKHGIVVEAYSPLAHGKKMDDPTIVEVAGHYDKSPAQIMIRWAIEHDMVVIPKSKSPERIAQNLSVFDFKIAKKDMVLLDNLNEDLRTCWDPTNVA